MWVSHVQSSVGARQDFRIPQASYTRRPRTPHSILNEMAQIRSQQLDKVTDKALSTIGEATGGTYFRRHLSSINLDAGLPSSSSTTLPSTSTSSSSTSSSSSSSSTLTGQKRRFTTDEKHQIDDFAASLLTEVTQRVKEDFSRYLDSTEVRSKLNVLDRLFVEQPKLPGGDGERIPAVLPEDPTNLLRAKRMRLKLSDKEGLEQLLVDAQQVQAHLESDLSRDRSLLSRCENELERRASMIDSAHSSLPPSAPVTAIPTQPEEQTKEQ